MKQYSLVLLFGLALWISSCETTKDPVDKPTAPQISDSMDLEEALKAAIDFGGITSRDVRKLVAKRKQWPQAEKILVGLLEDGIVKFDNPQIINATMLYVSGPVAPSEQLFKMMVGSTRIVVRQMAWQMAASLPSKTMRKAIESELNRALFDGDEADVLVPQMAAAVQSNRMPSAYSLVKQGLMTTGHEDFAMAMSVLNPTQASADFIDYLATCPPEELRQITVSSINVYSATTAMSHLQKNLPSLGHPQIETLFFYGISRNPGLSEPALQILDRLAATGQRNLAIALSRLPSWAQIAFIDTSKRAMSPNRRVLLTELRNMTAQNDVLEELSEIKF